MSKLMSLLSRHCQDQSLALHLSFRHASTCGRLSFKKTESENRIGRFTSPEQTQTGAVSSMKLKFGRRFSAMVLKLSRSAIFLFSDK